MVVVVIGGTVVVGGPVVVRGAVVVVVVGVVGAVLTPVRGVALQRLDEVVVAAPDPCSPRAVPCMRPPPDIPLVSGAVVSAEAQVTLRGAGSRA